LVQKTKLSSVESKDTRKSKIFDVTEKQSFSCDFVEKLVVVDFNNRYEEAKYK